jgi:hypothetical protein
MLPALWLVLGGAWLAHKRAARGPGYLLRAHILGSLAALALAVVGSMVIDTVTGNEGMHGLSLVFWIMVIPPWVAIGFAAAGLVPGSFSSGSSRVRAWRRAARPMPTELALVKDSHDAQ